MEVADLEIAMELQHHILGGWPLPCGCVLRVLHRFPTRRWLYANDYTRLCAFHSGVLASLKKKNGALRTRTLDKLLRQRSTRVRRWVTWQGDQVPKEEIREAVEKAKMIPEWNGPGNYIYTKDKEYVIAPDGNINIYLIPFPPG